MIPDICQETCRCPECGRWLVITDTAAFEFFACPMGHGRLIPFDLLVERVRQVIARIPPEKIPPFPKQVVRHLAFGSTTVLKHL